MEFENRVLLGTCLDVLKQIPSDTYDSCVTDVPYGLGKTPSVKQIVAYIQGADLVTGDFMGKKWDIPSVLVWREVFRVLKPGAHVVCFGGTRTFDLISLGLRAAGFINRDTIADNYPGLQWVQGQGMPKSHNLEKAIAEKMGAEEAQQFEGVGTGLKPTWEPILIFRKPFKGTLAKNALEHGTGGLNIDATRVKHANKADFEEHKKQVAAVKAKGGVRGDSWKNSSDLSGANDVKEAGRWPTNLTFTHAEGCVREGSKRVKGANAPGRKSRGEGERGIGFGDAPGKAAQIPFYTDPENYGTETVDAWQCVAGCPVAELDIQSGDRPSTLTGRADPHQSHAHPGTEFNANSTFLGERTFHSKVYADEGGASRFFPQFEGTTSLEVPFFFAPKTSKREKTLKGRLNNEHVTVKPKALMRWLIRLVTQKGGLVLDPYCGSGSTLHAAIEEGCRFTGIERDLESYETSSKRVAIVEADIEEASFGTSLFDLAMSNG
jgi:DNA modification methylase